LSTWARVGPSLEGSAILTNERIDSVETPEGTLELRRRGAKDFMILIGGQVLMTTSLTASELALAKHGCAQIVNKKAPRVLIGGLGLGFTLRAALDALPPRARVVVAELNSKVIEWCQGPVAIATKDAALDRRVRFYEGDVTEHVREVAADASQARYDAILWDLYVGPPARGGAEDPRYGDLSVHNAWEALVDGGVFGVWGEAASPAFEKRLGQHGFKVERVRLDGRAARHAVYLATKLPRIQPNRERSRR